MPTQPPQVKKTSPWIWILGGLAVFCFLVLAMCGVAGYMGVRFLKNSGFDKNPAIAMVKMATALNPDLDLVTSDEAGGTVTMRDRKTGKTVTYRYDADRKTLEIVGDNGEHVVVNGSGQGTATVETNDSTVRIGSGTAPAWVPSYPGSTPKIHYSANGNGGQSSSMSFETSDAGAKVIQYYEDKLKGDGFEVRVLSSNGDVSVLNAEDSDKQRNVILTVSKSGSGSNVTLMAVQK
jgi:hypothetical protein